MKECCSYDALGLFLKVNPSTTISAAETQSEKNIQSQN